MTDGKLHSRAKLGIIISAGGNGGQAVMGALGSVITGILIWALIYTNCIGNDKIVEIIPT